MTEPVDCFNTIPDEGGILFKHMQQKRIPASGSINLTDRCNLQCIHCYLGTRTAFDNELTTSEWIRILDEIADAGCLFLLITGGDPTLRADFIKIYKHIKNIGLLPSLFTNGTRITNEICNTLRKYPPRKVEISLYGATPATYEKVTGVPDMFDQCIKGIERLLDAGINVGLKTVLMTLNVDEYEQMEALAEKYDVPFRMDPLIFPKFNGDKSPLKLRVDPERAIACELKNEEKLNSLLDYYNRYKEREPSTKLYECGAARRTFHIDGDGTLRGCIMSNDVTYDLRQGNFLEGWEEKLPELFQMHVPLTNKCRSCKLKVLCGICPPIAKSERGDASAECSYVCALGENRNRMLKKTTNDQEA